MIDIRIIPLLKDNYAYILRGKNGETAVVDPGEEKPVIEALKRENLSLDYILNTHHHSDHIGGNAGLKKTYGARIAGPEKEKHRIPGMDILLREGDDLPFGDEEVSIIETPGHTSGHICYYFRESGVLFTGDTLFLMGTGRLFEGTAEQMWLSLNKIRALPDDTRIYCGHEYTLANGEFCLALEPDNKDLHRRIEEVRTLRLRNLPTIPGTLGEEKRTNLFLRADSPARLAEIRTLKDSF